MTFKGNDVEIESRVPAEVQAELTKRGHELKRIAPFSSSVGGGQAMLRDFATGINYGASDPRKDGAAIPER
jgi:gamma-glutamyltranspeptidase/glutathione hydrolase